MKKLIILFVLALIMNNLLSQTKSNYREGTSAQQNINSIINLAPYSDGAVGFDNRYQGIKGSVRLFDTLMPSFLKIKGQDYYIKLESDIDLVNNRILFIHPKTGKLLSIPGNIVIELIITRDTSDIVFRTTENMTFEKDIKELKFYQVLKETPVLFIKMAVKTFTEADFKGAYSADRRFDEYETNYKYYLSANDNVMHQCQLNRKDLLSLFPDKQDIIKKTIKEGKFTSKEDMVLTILEKF